MRGCIAYVHQRRTDACGYAEIRMSMEDASRDHPSTRRRSPDREPGECLPLRILREGVHKSWQVTLGRPRGRTRDQRTLTTRRGRDPARSRPQLV